MKDNFSTDHGEGEWDTVVQEVMQVMGSSRSFTHSPTAHLLLCSLVPNRPRTPGIDDLIYKAEIRDTDLENKHMDMVGGMNWEIGIDIYTLFILCIK